MERYVNLRRIRATYDTLALYRASRLDDASSVPGSSVTGVITKLERYGAFVDIGSTTEAFLGHLEANLSDLQVGQEVTCEIEAWRSGRYQLAQVGRLNDQEKAFHQLHACAGQHAKWMSGYVVQTEPHCLVVEVDIAGVDYKVQGEVHADQIRDGYVGDARLEKQLGDEVQVRVLQVDVPGELLLLSMRPDFSSDWRVTSDQARQLTAPQRRKWFPARVLVTTPAGYLVTAQLLGPDNDPVPALLPSSWVERQLREGSKASVRLADIDVAAGRVIVTALRSSGESKQTLSVVAGVHVVSLVFHTARLRNQP